MEIIALGPITFHSYGLLIGLGIWAVLWWAERIVRDEQSLRSMDVSMAAWWMVLPGLVGARLFHVVHRWEWYAGDWSMMLAIWQGGMSIWGGLLLGLVGLGAYATMRQLSWRAVGDVVGLSAPLGHVIGRFGNFVNQELYGLPTNLPWGLPIEPHKRLVGYEAFERFHPLFLYEVVAMLVVWGCFQVVHQRKVLNIGSGRLMAGYLIGYGLVRVVLEPLRIEQWWIGGWNMGMVMGAILIGLGVMIGYRHARKV